MLQGNVRRYEWEIDGGLGIMTRERLLSAPGFWEDNEGSTLVDWSWTRIAPLHQGVLLQVYRTLEINKISGTPQIDSAERPNKDAEVRKKLAYESGDITFLWPGHDFSIGIAFIGDTLVIIFLPDNSHLSTGTVLYLKGNGHCAVRTTLEALYEAAVACITTDLQIGNEPLAAVLHTKASLETDPLDNAIFVAVSSLNSTLSRRILTQQPWYWWMQVKLPFRCFST